MYLIATHIPIHTDCTRHYTDISWQRDLILAQDWLAGPYGGLGVIAPSLPLQAGDERGMVLVSAGLDDGIRIFPSFHARNSARQSWLRDPHEWSADVQRALADMRVFHTSACDVYKPVAFMAHAAAAGAGLPPIFVGPDIDVHFTLRLSVAHAGWHDFQTRLTTEVFARLLDTVLQKSIGSAAMTPGRAL